MASQKAGTVHRLYTFDRGEITASGQIKRYRKIEPLCGIDMEVVGRFEWEGVNCKTCKELRQQLEKEEPEEN